LSIGKVAQFRAANKKCCEVPFNSTNKYQVIEPRYFNIPSAPHYNTLLKYIG